MMLKSSVDNLVWEKQRMLKEVPILVKDEATQCSQMLTALVMNQLLGGAYILDGGGGPILILKMLVLSVKVVTLKSCEIKYERQ